MIVGELSASGTGVVATPYEAAERNEIGYTATYCPTLTIQIGKATESTDDVITVNGAVITSWEISGKVGELITYSCDFQARTAISSTTVTAYTAPSDDPFNFVEATAYLNGATRTATVLKCQSFNVKGANEFAFSNELSTRVPVQPVLKSRKYDFTLEVLMTTDATATVLDAQELRAKILSSTNTFSNSPTPTECGDLNILISEGAANADKVMSIELENCYFDSISEPIDIGNGTCTMTINGFALQGSTDGSVATDFVPFRWYAVLV